VNEPGLRVQFKEVMSPIRIETMWLFRSMTERPS